MLEVADEFLQNGNHYSQILDMLCFALSYNIFSFIISYYFRFIVLIDALVPNFTTTTQMTPLSPVKDSSIVDRLIESDCMTWFTLQHISG